MLVSENNTDKAELEEVAELVFGWQRFNRFYKLLNDGNAGNAEHPF
jgi:hypothetical protein